jgi:hypothetical protein
MSSKNPMRFLAACTLAVAGACVGPAPADLPTDHDWMVVVGSVRLPDYMDWYTRFAEHAWIDLKQGDEDSWTRIEISGTISGVEIFPTDAQTVRDDFRWDNRAAVLEVYYDEEARELIPRILANAAAVEDFGHSEFTREEDGGWTISRGEPEGRPYDAWPGPNSNTLIAQIIDATPGLHAELHHNSVGKDYPDIFRAGPTASGYGLEFDFGLLGAGLGRRQGAELHLFGLTAGISLWPPALKIPLIPRIGIHQGWVGTME